MRTSESSTLSLPDLPIDRQQPRPAPERGSAVAVGVLAIGSSSWVLLILPIQAACILTLASVLAWLAWIRTTHAHPVTSPKVIATYLCAVAFQFVQFVFLPQEWRGLRRAEQRPDGSMTPGVWTP